MLRDEQLALDIAFQGQPFCQVATTEAAALDAVYLGEPFCAEILGGIPPATPAYTNPIFFGGGF